MTNVAVIDTLRTINFSGISAVYAPVGPSFSHVTRIVCFTNNTDGDMFVSTDGVVDMLFLPANSFKLFDLSTNRADYNSLWSFPEKLQILVRQSTAPSKGDFYVECIYASGE